MPPKNASGTKRKAPLAAADSNVAPPAKKVVKGKMVTVTSSGTTASSGAKTYKYSNPSSLEKDLPKMYTFHWARDDEDEDEDEDDDEDEDEEDESDKADKTAEKDKDEDNAENCEEEHSRQVTDNGFPITKAGLDMFMHIIEEQEKRDPDCHRMYIYNDFAGYGMTEVLENVLADFNKILFKKDVSPLKKWSYVEGLVTWLYAGDLMPLMMSDDSERTGEIFQFFVTFMVTSLEVLSEHSLIAPASAIPNAATLTLIMIKFLQKDAADHEIEDVEKIVQAADKAGVQWDFRKVGVSEEDVNELRECIQTRAKKPDWKKEWPSFRRNHPGGKNYDITKMSKAEKKQYEFGRSGGRV